MANAVARYTPNRTSCVNPRHFPLTAAALAMTPPYLLSMPTWTLRFDVTQCAALADPYPTLNVQALLGIHGRAEVGHGD